MYNSKQGCRVLGLAQTGFTAFGKGVQLIHGPPYDETKHFFQLTSLSGICATSWWWVTKFGLRWQRKTLLIPRHSLSAFSERRPSRALDLVLLAISFCWLQSVPSSYLEDGIQGMSRGKQYLPFCRLSPFFYLHKRMRQISCLRPCNYNPASDYGCRTFLGETK